jgi:hypothetical protein
VFDRNLARKTKEIERKTSAGHTPVDNTSECMSCIEPDGMTDLARKIKQMARTLHQTEASHRAIIEDQAFFICRYKPDGHLKFTPKGGVILRLSAE